MAKTEDWIMLYAAHVTFSGYDPQLLGKLSAVGASRPQTYLLQRILRAIEPDALLTHHAATLGGLAIDVPRAQAALKSHSERSQPNEKLLSHLCKNAAATVARSHAFQPSDQVLINMASVLASVPPVVNGKAPNISKGTSLSLAAQLNAPVQKIPPLLIAMFKKAWSSPSTAQINWQYLTHVGDEIACLLASSDRDRITLDEQLAHALTRVGQDPDAIMGILLPTKRRYHVACVIRGAGTFTHLTALEPSAQQSSVENSIQWGAANDRLAEFLRKIHGAGEQCVLSIDVDSVDKASAARLGRRRITELLDQYVAGHRLVSLSLGLDTLVARAGAQNDAQEWQPKRQDVRQAYPLLNNWPKGIREGLRMAHISRTTDSPLASAALAWVALEACGIKHHNCEKLARVLALQAMRQQIVEAHQELMQSVRSSRKYSKTQSKNNAALVRKYQAGLARCPAQAPARAHLESSLAAAIKSDQAADSERQRLDSEIFAPLKVIGKYAASDQRYHLADLNKWVDLLLPPRTSDDPELTAARSALTAIEPHLSPLTARQLADWRHRLQYPNECATWLVGTQGRICALLDALYSARNISLHSGIFDATGDVVLGQGGIMIADLTLEFLGNWYLTGAARNYTQTPIQVVQELAGRQERIINKLKALKGPAYPLNIGLLTSPVSPEGWDRT